MYAEQIALSPAFAAKVLLIDDDRALANVLGPALREAGFRVEVAYDGFEGFQRFCSWQSDLVILDLLMPRMDGWETCRQIREVSQVPILIMTASGDEVHELAGLRAGADMYIAKPFALPILVARLRALLRRSRFSAGPTPTLVTVGDLRIDVGRQRVTRSGQPVELSPTEFRLLAALATRPGRVVSHRELLVQVWGPEYAAENPYLKLYIRYLRNKIEEDPSHPRYIITKRFVGYCLAGAA